MPYLKGVYVRRHPDYGYICSICEWVTGKPVMATRICNQTGKPVCDNHARHCDNDGHGHRELTED